eukprot:11546577-Karenia_brevis.AAC.1
MMMATTVPHKGGRGGFAVDRRMEFRDENRDSHNNMLVKSDTEESMRLLIKMIKEERLDGKTVVEEAPRKVKGSIGVVEKALQELEGACKSHFAKFGGETRSGD